MFDAGLKTNMTTPAISYLIVGRHKMIGNFIW